MAWACFISPQSDNSDQGTVTATWNKGMDDTFVYTRVCSVTGDTDMAAFIQEAQSAYDANANLLQKRLNFADSVASSLNGEYKRRLEDARALQEAADREKVKDPIPLRPAPAKLPVSKLT